jgi:hypothetical protein
VAIFFAFHLANLSLPCVASHPLSAAFALKPVLVFQRFLSDMGCCHLLSVQKMIMDLFKDLDTNGDGSLSYKEFSQGLTRLNVAPKTGEPHARCARVNQAQAPGKIE